MTDKTTSGVKARWRDEVVAFADLMEAQLRANDHKPGWGQDYPDELLERLIEEVEELKLEIWRSKSRSANWAEAVGRIGLEAADVANFAMMIADVCGAVKR